MSLSEKTKLQYENIYSIIEKSFDGKVDYEDTEKVMSIIKTKKDGKSVSDWTLKNRLVALTHKSDNKVYKDELKKITSKIRKVTESEEANKQKEGEFTFDDFNKLFNSVEGIEKMIIGLYLLNPPRRITDYTEMIVKQTRPSRMNPDTNYLVLDEKLFVFNNYKTRHIYNRQIVPIADSLFKLLENQVQENNYLLINKFSNKKFTEAQFSDYLRRLSVKHIGKPSSVTAFRHAYISNFLSMNPSTSQRKLISEMMAHNVAQQLDYDRRV